MKLKAPGAAAATARSPANWFLGICLAAFLRVIWASAATDAQISAEGWSPAERWVVERVTAGEEANLDTALNPDTTQKFPKKEDRKISGHFLQELLKGTLTGVQPQRIGVRILGATIDGSIDISNERIPCDIWLENCQFMSKASIHHASFAWNVSFQYSTFKDVADFNSIKVEHIAWFLGTKFEGRVDFRYANIGGEFGAKGARFQNEEIRAGSRALFSGMKVGGDAIFEGAEFEGPVDFSYANITNNFNANGAKFQNEIGAISRALFSGMKVGGDAIFEGAEFEGPVDFSYANITNNFNANGAKFQNEKNGAVFSGMKVGGDATFYSAAFEGPVRFNHADFALLSLSSPFSPKVAAQFHMQGMSYKYIRAIPQSETESESHTNPRRAYPLSPASPVPLIFPSSPYQQRAAFIRAVRPEPESEPHIIIPRRPLPWYLETAAYFSAIPQPEPESESSETLLQLAGGSAYSADVYSSLEQFFLRRGDRADADKAFIAGKSRERDEYRRSGHWFGWLRSWMLYLLVAYGRRPWQAGIYYAVLIALGCVLFSPKKMEPQRPEDAPRVYSRFWYSLGLFLPFVDLQSNKMWKPKVDQTFLRNYMRVHILLGWILVPLVLAALTGLIK